MSSSIIESLSTMMITKDKQESISHFGSKLETIPTSKCASVNNRLINMKEEVDENRNVEKKSCEVKDIVKEQEIIEDSANSAIMLTDSADRQAQDVKKVIVFEEDLQVPDCEGKNKFMWWEFGGQLKWNNIIAISILHFFGAIGILIFPFLLHRVRIWTTLWALTMGGVGGFGVTAGVHRLWCHRSYKAKTPLRIILMLCYSAAGQNTIFEWVRDHRVHHKYSETDADPHNANRGFFFAHCGWLMMYKHPKVIKRGNQLDMSDVLSDPVVQFHEKNFWALKILLCHLIPLFVPIYFWNETWYYAVLSQNILRYMFSLNFTWLVNSAAHIWGQKPYDKRISPTENKLVAMFAMGEGWHNYHHVFPWDYKAAELGNYSFNVTTFWLDLFAKIGWAYDMKQPSKELVCRVVKANGDGTHSVWGDKEVSVEEDRWRQKCS